MGLVKMQQLQKTREKMVFFWILLKYVLPLAAKNDTYE